MDKRYEDTKNKLSKSFELAQTNHENLAKVERLATFYKTVTFKQGEEKQYIVSQESLSGQVCFLVSLVNFPENIIPFIQVITHFRDYQQYIGNIIPIVFLHDENHYLFFKYWVGLGNLVDIYLYVPNPRGFYEIQSH